MDKIVSQEERIRRAEEIYYRRKAQGVRVSTSSVNVNKQRISLGKKMGIQIIICCCIYAIIVWINQQADVSKNGAIWSVRNFLNYDVNISELVANVDEYLNKQLKNNAEITNADEVGNTEGNEKSAKENVGENEQGTSTGVIQNFNKSIEEALNGRSANDASTEEQLTETAIEGENISGSDNAESAEEVSETNGSQEKDNNTVENAEQVQTQPDTNTQQNNNATSTNVKNDGTIKAKEDSKNVQQMSEDAEYIKQNCSLIIPVKGAITSKFGYRDETEIISAFHQGVDIRGTVGTPIYASMSGDVVAASFAGEYGNHIKIQNGEVLTVYAHCSEIDVNVGDHIEQGQEIGKVGATGKVTRATFAF